MENISNCGIEIYQMIAGPFRLAMPVRARNVSIRVVQFIKYDTLFESN